MFAKKTCVRSFTRCFDVHFSRSDLHNINHWFFPPFRTACAHSFLQYFFRHSEDMHCPTLGNSMEFIFNILNWNMFNNGYIYYSNRILIAKWQQLMVTARQDQAEQKSDYDRSHRSKCNRIHHTHKKVHSTQWVHKVKTTTASNIEGGKGLSLILCTSWRIKTGTELCRSMTRRDQEEKKLYHQQIIQDTDTGQRIKGRGRRITLQSMSKYSSRSLSLSPDKYRSR